MHDEQRWQAVLTRDVQADGAFVYAVRSTGIYCKPSCPSRKPGRAQVLFFAQPQTAEQAGYRACRRCQPRQEEAGPTVVAQICTYIEQHLEETLTLAQLGEEIHMSPFHLQRTFKQAMGITPRQYIETCRLQQLKSRLRQGETVTSALYDAGYGSSSRLYEHAPAQLGMTPTAYRRGGKGMQIAYSIAESALGLLLVAATVQGVCAVYLGDQPTELENTLRQEYPAAAIERDNEGQFAAWVQQLLQYLDGQQDWERVRLNLPIDVQATAFQWRVWETLRSIPAGETRTYGEVAESLGDKNKARAVAQACASNPVALIVPCHRVVRGDGAEGGYRWGAGRKRRLLSQEKDQQKEIILDGKSYRR
ncbi:MAG: bifunctional DNA-binding transcriptional regulator/O6-methylguanine-DNA methyltransferase Ada [Ktedonobacteraceae bacterium]